MTPRNNQTIYAVVAVALVVVLTLTILGAESGGIPTLTVTVTSTATTTTTVSFSVKAYEVAFQQVPCGTQSPLYVQDWSVMLGNRTMIRPANGTIPQDDGVLETADYNASSIAFYVPDGVYRYDIHPTFGFPRQNTSGVIDVNGSDVSLYLDAYCGPISGQQ